MQYAKLSPAASRGTCNGQHRSHQRNCLGRKPQLISGQRSAARRDEPHVLHQLERRPVQGSFRRPPAPAHQHHPRGGLGIHPAERNGNADPPDRPAGKLLQGDGTAGVRIDRAIQHVVHLRGCQWLPYDDARQLPPECPAGQGRPLPGRQPMGRASDHGDHRGNARRFRYRPG